MLKHISPPELVGRSRREDRYEKRVSNWIKPWDYEEEIDAGLVMVPSGAPRRAGCRRLLRPRMPFGKRLS